MQHFLKTSLAVGAFALSLGMAQAQDLAPLNSDSEPDRMDWSELEAKFGLLPAPAAGTKVVASVPANWSREEAFNAAATILQQYPDLVGFYANNDGMALGVVEAVKAAGKQDSVVVFGTDGISDAYAAIRAGDLTGTVDSFPVLTGEVAMEVALRLLAGQPLPRVVATPQALITKDNVETYATSDMAALRAALMAK